MLPILIGKKYIYKENTFSNFKDNSLIVLWLLQILLNLSRIAIVNMLVGIVAFIACGVYKKVLNLKNSFRIIIVILIISVLGVAFVGVMPDEAKERFEEKFTNSLTEISSENEYDSISDAQSDWRGYEIQCAQEQWKNSDLLTQLIGAGNGTLISLHYIPDQWKQTVEIQNGRAGVTILHNTYYTFLIKGGLLLVIALLVFMLLNIVNALKALSKVGTENMFYVTMIIAFFVLILIDAYVIRNMMDKGAEMVVLLLIGWGNAKLNRERNNRHINITI